MQVDESVRVPRRLGLTIAAGVLVATVVLVAVGAEYGLRHAEPMLRASVVETLAGRFHSPVELDSLHVSLVRGIEVEGKGLRVLYLAGPTRPEIEQVEARRDGRPLPAMLSVKRFLFHLSLEDLKRMDTRIARVEVEGAEVHIPPHSMGGVFASDGAAAPAKRPRFHLVVGKIVFRDMRLFLETDRPGKDALRFDIRRLELTDVGAGRPLLYTAEVVNPRPTGDVRAFGHLGPWDGAEPRATPIDGHFLFEHADLSTIRGIRGTLSAVGDFKGQLGRLAVESTTDVPEFALDVSARPEHLVAEVHSTVDGTTGDTYLNQVHARLGGSAFDTQGAVVRVHMPDNSEGHDISLAVQMPQGRMEDLLGLGMKTNPPVLRGGVGLRAKLHIPPGKERVAEKLQLAGSLKVQGVEFSNAKVQDRVDGLSMRAQGRPEEVKVAGADRRAEVASQMAVQFTVAHALVTVPSLRYEVPGATILLDGVYSMDGSLFEFKGHVRTEATASQMVTGWRSLLLKPLDPLLKKNGAGVELPVAISGAQGEFRVGLAMRHADESTAGMAADLKARRAAQRATRP